MNENLNQAEQTSAKLPFYRTFSKKTFIIFLAFVTISTLAAFLVGGFILGSKDLPAARQEKKNPPSGEQRVCAQDAKQCPDGSYVNRTGPNCEFSPCPKSSPTPPIDPTANWKTYINLKYGYSIKYPPKISLKDRDSDYIELDKQIIINVSKYSPENCRGGCPLIKTISDTEINGLKGKKIIGEMGSVGGTIPQNYQSLIFSHNNQYYIFTVYELKTDSAIPYDQERTIGNIPDNEIKLLNQILQTFKFNN